MKRFPAIMLATIFFLCSSLTAFAEDANINTNQPPQMGDGAPEGIPPEMPEGGFPGGPGGTPPEKPDGRPGGHGVAPVMRPAGSRATWKGSSDPGRWAAPTRTALKAMTMLMTPRCM